MSEDIEVVKVGSKDRVVIPKRFKGSKYVGIIAINITKKENEEVDNPDQEIPSTSSHK